MWLRLAVSAFVLRTPLIKWPRRNIFHSQGTSGGRSHRTIQLIGTWRRLPIQHNRCEISNCPSEQILEFFPNIRRRISTLITGSLKFMLEMLRKQRRPNTDGVYATWLRKAHVSDPHKITKLNEEFWTLSFTQTIWYFLVPFHPLFGFCPIMAEKLP